MHKIPSDALHFAAEGLSNIVLADSNISESGTPSSWVLHSSSYDAWTGRLILLVLQFRHLILYQAAKWD